MSAAGPARDAFAGATLPALFAAELLAECEERGVRSRALLAEASLEAAAVADLEAPLAAARLFDLWAAAMRAVRDPGLPVAVARRFTIERYPLLGFAVMTAETLRASIDRVVRFGALVAGAGRWSLALEGSEARCTWSRPGARTLGLRAANESAVAEFLHAARQIAPRIAVARVSFSHPPPADARAHEQHFGVRPRWDAPCDELVFPTSALELVPRLANPALSKLFERQAQAALARRESEQLLRDRVARAVADALPEGEPSLAQVARRLAMGERTLRRALAVEGKPFRDLMTDVRRERAKALLAEGACSLAEVALLTGFSELSAFSRAFKRWTGRAPSDARARPLAAPVK